ncbi:hypothetical protein [Glycomyces harbinensis]|uniref:Uncharacterized protein n=1 Tax=Glycomyces harbinensis TaxID=58114 RepID=A0A1G6Z389_9ACTN|nr:hypothetical protein [Glycomyces harbinensis]SDD97129.1 hypothetical protein SAMN05216270_11031 [Glycomyces harbinensis]
MESPPESVYTQAESYAPAEGAVADLVAALPDFPGFAKRSWAELPCTRAGVEDPDYTNVELRYQFSAEDSATPLVNERYVDLLREHWRGLGHEIIRDDTTELDDATYRDLTAVREDGITLWYSAAHLATLMVQSGCVPRSDPSEIPYVPPSGGIRPGGKGDGVGEYFPEGIPAARPANPFDAPDTYDDQL